MAINLTSAAAERVRQFMQNQPEALGLRLGIKVNGCSGFAYVVELAESVNDDDQIFESHGIKVVVDAKSMEVVDGTEIGYSTKGLNQGFDYNNPKMKSLCGCGESFGV
jgi:iron-sulfur cluster assembly protein